MFGIDTNVLLRYVIKDDLAQAGKATRFIEETIARGESLFVNRLVLCETVWALHQSYRVPKSEIIKVIETLIQMERFILDGEKEVEEALEAYRSRNLNFSDALIAIGNRTLEATHTVTFDKKAAHLPEFRLLT